MSDAPERIKLYTYQFNGVVYYTSNSECGYMPNGLPSEYIHKNISIKLRNEWFNRGVKAGKISNNKSGCYCVFEDDGETITNMCTPHKDKM